MKKNVKILTGVVVVAAVVVGGYFVNVGGLKGCIGRACFRTSPVDLSVTSVKIADTNYSGVPYFRVTAGIKSNASVATDWKVQLNGKDYTKTMGWQTVPANTSTDYSFDIMKSVACDGNAPHTISVNLDPNNKIAESNENNNGASNNFVCNFVPPVLSDVMPSASCDSFGGKWTILIDGYYNYKYDPIYSSDRETLDKVVKGDVLNLMKEIDNKTYNKYCYTQEAVNPKNDKLNASRLCDSMAKLYGPGDGVTDESNYTICKILDKLPGGPDMFVGDKYLYDKVGLSPNTGMSVGGVYGDSTALYKDRMSTNVGLPSGNVSASFFMNAFDVLGDKNVNQKVRITIRGQK